jgi:hypothetical protein
MVDSVGFVNETARCRGEMSSVFLGLSRTFTIGRFDAFEGVAWKCGNSSQSVNIPLKGWVNRDVERGGEGLTARKKSLTTKLGGIHNRNVDSG